MALTRRTKIGFGVAGGVLVLGLAGAGTALAVAGDGDGDAATGAEVIGAAADQARSAAVAAVPGGQAGPVRTDSDGGAVYSVQVTRPDSSKVEVHLDATNNVIGSQPAAVDNDGGDGDEG